MEWISPHSIQQNNNNNNNENHEIFQRVLKHRQVKESDTTKYTALLYGDNDDTEGKDKDITKNSGMCLLIQMEPFFMVALYRISDISAGPILELNRDQLLHTEIRRTKKSEEKEEVEESAAITADAETTDKIDNPDKEIVGYWEDGLAIYADGTREEKKVIPEESEQDAEHETHRKLLETDQDGQWEETFGSHVDTKPNGPMSVGIDISFPQSQHVYGIPEHASRAELQTTLRRTLHDEDAYYQEPYRL